MDGGVQGEGASSKAAAGGERTLADIIMQKLATGDYIDGDKLDK